MRAGDLVSLNNPVDQVRFQGKLGLVVSRYYDDEIYHCAMARVLFHGEAGTITDLPVKYLDVIQQS